MEQVLGSLLQLMIYTLFFEDVIRCKDELINAHVIEREKQEAEKDAQDDNIDTDFPESQEC